MTLSCLPSGDYSLSGWGASTGVSVSSWNSYVSGFDSQFSGCGALSGWTSTLNNDLAECNFGTSGWGKYVNLGWSNAASNGSGGGWWNPWQSDQLTLCNTNLCYTATEGSGVSNLYQAVVNNVHASNCWLGGGITIESVSATNTQGFVSFDAKDQTLSYSASGYTGGAADSFTYTAQDAYGNTVTGSVCVNVTAATPGLTTVLGTQGDDTIFATYDNQRVDSLGGNDTVFALKNNVAVYAGSGNDMIFVNGVNDTVYAGSGHDTITINGANPETLILPQATVGFDDVYGFNCQTDKLDLSSLLAGTKWNGGEGDGGGWWGENQDSNISNYVKFTAVSNGSGVDTLVSVNQSGSCYGAWTQVADIHGVNVTNCNLQTITSHVTNALNVSQGGGSHGWWG